MLDESQTCATKLRTPKPMPYGAKMITARQKYEMDLEKNVRILSLKYPQESGLKLKDLLEQLDNNHEMVQDVLKQEGLKPSAESRDKEQKPQRESCKDPEKKFLMKAIAKLYNKLQQSTVENATLKEQNNKLKKESTFYKTRNSLLIQEQLNNEFDENLHIY